MIGLLPKWLENRFERKTQFIGAQPIGVEWSITVPANKIWIVLSIYSSWLTGPTVANRVPRLQYESGGQIISFNRTPLTVPASSGVTLTSSIGIFDVSSGTGGYSMQLPYLPLVEGDIIRSAISNWQVDDRHNVINLTYLEADVTQPL